MLSTAGFSSAIAKYSNASNVANEFLAAVGILLGSSVSTASATSISLCKGIPISFENVKSNIQYPSSEFCRNNSIIGLVIVLTELIFIGSAITGGGGIISVGGVLTIAVILCILFNL